MTLFRYYVPLAMVLIIFMSGCVNRDSTVNTASKTLTNSENLRIAEVNLPGMFCPGCARSAEKAFEGMAGVVDAKVDIKAKKGAVIYDSSVTSKEQLTQNAVIRSYDGEVISDQKYVSTGK